MFTAANKDIFEEVILQDEVTSEHLIIAVILVSGLGSVIDLCLKIVLRIFLLMPSMNSLKTHLSRKHMSLKLIKGCEILSLLLYNFRLWKFLRK